MASAVSPLLYKETHNKLFKSQSHAFDLKVILNSGPELREIFRANHMDFVNVVVVRACLMRSVRLSDDARSILKLEG